MSLFALRNKRFVQGAIEGCEVVRWQVVILEARQATSAASTLKIGFGISFLLAFGKRKSIRQPQDQ
jgi:hypothetical protein